MKFIYFPLPAIPATLEDRRRERPIAYRTERWQKMFDEVVELAWLSDQGMLPIEEVKRQLRIFGEQVLPHYRS